MKAAPPRRTASGVLDFACYKARARRLRRRWLARWVGRLLRALRRRRARHALAALDEIALHDLGLGRCECTAAARHDFYRDASRRPRGRPPTGMRCTPVRTPAPQT